MHKVDLSRAIAALRNGGIIVYPTDTLYALGADIFHESAVRKVFGVKKRPRDIPLPIAVSSLDDVEKIAFVNECARSLAECFLPGPLTLILNKKNIIPNVVTAQLDKVAVRIPDNDVAIELLTRFGPLTVTSANVHGMETPSVISDIKMQFKDYVDVYLNYGRLDALASTIVDITKEEPKIVREGIISRKEILDAI